MSRRGRLLQGPRMWAAISSQIAGFYVPWRWPLLLHHERGSQEERPLSVAPVASGYRRLASLTRAHHSGTCGVVYTPTTIWARPPATRGAHMSFPPADAETRSFYLGMIYAFIEVVASGCKRLALSPPMTADELAGAYDSALAIAGEYGVLTHHDDDCLETRLF